MSDEPIDILEELQQLLDQSHAVALRLQQDIPGSEFPTAYKINKVIRALRKATNDLHVSLDPESSEYVAKFFEADLVNSSDSSVGA
jgi:uncharacterized membrane protein YccC